VPDYIFKHTIVLNTFYIGYVLTRIVWKGCHALASLGEHARELEVIEALLAQCRWRRGRRGGWHDRRALILMKHRPKVEETWQVAMKAVMEALEDNDTHLS
jgi:fanconi-associated nuclease 1